MVYFSIRTGPKFKGFGTITIWKGLLKSIITMEIISKAIYICLRKLAKASISGIKNNKIKWNIEASSKKIIYKDSQ